jgi:hypothetical protein
MFEICQLDNTKFEAFQKIINTLSTCDFFSIRNGKINHFINHIVIDTDLSSILGNDFSIDIIEPKKYTKLLKTFPKNNIKLFDDTGMQRFVLSSNNAKLFFPKKAGIKTIEDIGLNLTPVGKPIEITDNTKKEIKNIIGTGEVSLLIHDNYFKGLLSPETSIYIFDDYTSEDLSEDDCEIVISYGFMLLDSDKYKITIGKDRKNEYWMYTEIDFIDDIKFYLTENLVKKSINNILI